MKLRLPVAFATLFLTGAPAFADSIDGHWCSGDGRHIQISGVRITTSSGVQMEGSYTRHTFAYVAPAAEPEAGGTVNMQLMGETRVSVQAAGGDARIWKRCENVS